MSKVQIKERIGAHQQNLCALSGQALGIHPSLIDTDRINERFNGGTYTDENTRIVEPRAHMARHGTLREREEWLETLKSLMDDRAQTMKLFNKINNQLLAYRRRTDHAHPETERYLMGSLQPHADHLKAVDRSVTSHLKAGDDPLIDSALGVKSVGPITVAGLLTYVDLEKAGSASALWAYTGLHRASHDRYTKGETSGGNKTLRTIIWNTANSMTKNRACPYRDVYDRTKERLSVSEKITKSRNTQGHLIECAWRDTKPGHRHGAALRAVMKHFLADYWFVGREVRGLDTRPLYVQEQLGHTGIISPRDRGWVW